MTDPRDLQKWQWTLTLTQGEKHGIYRQINQQGEVLEYPVEFEIAMFPLDGGVIRWDTEGARKKKKR